jgi:hypothetical protein
MDRHDNKPAAYSEDRQGPRVKDLFDLETWAWEKGVCEFEYDEYFGIFRFYEDGRFAFSREFADWQLLEERGYVDL